jgi:hypothetical protein
MTSTVAPAERNGTEDQTVIERAASGARDAGRLVRIRAGDASAVVARRGPAALAASRGRTERAIATLRGSSNGSLALGTVFAAGVSGGMLLSGAHRMLVALAFLPTLLLGGTLVRRGTTGLEEPSRGART